MDLSKRLLVWLASLATLWLLAIGVYAAVALRSGVADEMHGANAVVELLSTAAEAHGGDAHSQLRLQALIADGGARHLTARWADEPRSDPLEQVSLLHAYARKLAPEGKPAPQHRIAIGPRTLVIEPAPDSEIDEVLDDVLPLFAVLLAAGVAMLVGTWWIVRQALAPASALCAGLARLQAGAAAPDFPRLRLREYAAIAHGIERLAAGLVHARGEQSRLAQNLIDVQERERRELARDLHDEFGQHLTAMSANASVLQRHAAQLDPGKVSACAEQIADSLRCIAVQLRDLLGRLRPHGLDAGSLSQELAALIEKARSRHPTVRVEADLAPDLPLLSDDAALAVYRSLQEALTNAFRHSGASVLQVALDVPTPHAVRLRVSDDGRGRVLPADGGRVRVGRPGDPPGRGIGLLGMHERLAMVGGQLRLSDHGATGVCVEIRVPTVAAPYLGPAEPVDGPSGEMRDPCLAA